MPPLITEPAIYTIGHSTRPLDQFIALLNAHGVRQLADVRTVPRSRRHPHFSWEALSRSLSEAGIQYRHFAALGGLRKPRADSTNTAWRHAGFRGYADYMETPAFVSALDELLAFADIASCRVLGTHEDGGASASMHGAEAERIRSVVFAHEGGSAGASMREDGTLVQRSVLETHERHGASASMCEDGALARRSVLNTHERYGASASVRGGGAPRTVIMCAEAVWWRCHRQLIADALVGRGIEVRHIGSTSQVPPHSLTDFALIEGQMVVYRRLI